MAEPLTGKKLQDKVAQMKGADKKAIAKACGYVTRTKNGQERISLMAFYNALLEAEDLSVAEYSEGGSRYGTATYKVSVSKSGSIIIGAAYTRELGLEPGDEFEIKLGRKSIALTRLDESSVRRGIIKPTKAHSRNILLYLDELIRKINRFSSKYRQSSLDALASSFQEGLTIKDLEQLFPEIGIGFMIQSSIFLDRRSATSLLVKININSSFLLETEKLRADKFFNIYARNPYKKDGKYFYTYSEIFTLAGIEINDSVQNRLRECRKISKDTDTDLSPTITLLLDVEYSNFTQENEHALISEIKDLLNIASLDVIFVQPGSTHLSLRLSLEDTETLFWAVKNGKLSHLKIHKAEIMQSCAKSIIDSKVELGKYDVFICYDTSDRQKVESIAKELLANGIRPWLDIWDMRPGCSWQQELTSRISSIHSAAVFIGPSGFGPWQQPEVEALISQFAERRCPIIPVILEECESELNIPLFLRGIHMVDFRECSQYFPIDMLIWGITGRKINGLV